MTLDLQPAALGELRSYSFIARQRLPSQGTRDQQLPTYAVTDWKSGGWHSSKLQRPALSPAYSTTITLAIAFGAKRGVCTMRTPLVTATGMRGCEECEGARGQTVFVRVLALAIVKRSRSPRNRVFLKAGRCLNSNQRFNFPDGLVGPGGIPTACEFGFR